MSLTKRRGVLVFPEIRSCVKVEVDVLGSPSLMVLTVSVDVTEATFNSWPFRAQELCESRGGRSRLPFLNIRTVSVEVKQF